MVNQHQLADLSHLHVPEALSDALAEIIPNTRLIAQYLPLVDVEQRLALWLIAPDLPTEKIDDEIIRKIWYDTPYWIFCWASGLALAQYILRNPDTVKDKTVLDFGAGSGVVAIACKLAGAKRVIACDIDPISLVSCAENARLNGVELAYLDDLYALDEPIDVLFAGDVLYDLSNRFFLDEFLKFTPNVWVADSRVRNFTHDFYTKMGQYSASTWPDLDEANEFRNVSFYTSLAVNKS